jgi:SecD/SecF fusion protein
MKPFTSRIIICLLPVLVSIYLVGVAWSRYVKGESGTPSFKLGVDLVGGTILVYEVDLDKFPDRQLPEGYDAKTLAAAIKRRIDPNDLYNVTIRPVSETRLEIILPTGGAHQARIEEQAWRERLEKLRTKWPVLEKVSFDAYRGEPAELEAAVSRELRDAVWKDLLAKVKAKWPQLAEPDLARVPVGNTDALLAEIQKQKVASDAEVKKFIDFQPPSTREVRDFFQELFPESERRKDISAEQVARFKRLISQEGSLEFRILANEEDDKKAFEFAQEYLKNPNNREELRRRAQTGLPPPALVRSPEGTEGFETTREELGRATYTWYPVGATERKSLGLTKAAGPRGNALYQQLQRARADDLAEAKKSKEDEDFSQAYLVVPDSKILLYSREMPNPRHKANEPANKVEFFLLVRDPERDPVTGQLKQITGKGMSARPDQDRSLRPAVSFHLPPQSGSLFYEVTSKNRPTGPRESQFHRLLAIILNGEIESAPRLITTIGSDGQITGDFTAKQVDEYVRILRAGALPAALKRDPVSENTIGPTLGEDTIRAGTLSVGFAFLAVMAFMVLYYRFAGLVACIALMANLLLTVGFMVLVNATFTLPGLAGLVLMLGMAVDANVLIYERLREERERGASLALAIRNGYDRAFPTIIDTHLSSIFTAIVLYAVGNDQLKGFGVSLTVGLVISLFTSLYMTRLIFDIWQTKGWLHKLSMFKLFSRPNIDFMRIRYAMFSATVALSVLGVGLFLIRGKDGLNIDFIGGTAYGGQLAVDPNQAAEEATVTELRRLLHGDRQQYLLSVKKVEQTDEDGYNYLITYNVGTPDTTRQVSFSNKPAGETKEEREAQVKERAERLPDWSVEQIYVSSDLGEGPSGRFFTVRTSEKEPDLVQVTLDRLLREERTDPQTGQKQWVSVQKGTKLNRYQVEAREQAGRKALEAVLFFSDPASPAQVKLLLERVLHTTGGIQDQQPAEIRGEGESKEGRFQQMRVILAESVANRMTEAKLKQVLDKLKEEFDARPQPERLENFDSNLAAETQQRAMYAILASWVAILLYLWFRFGNWTFGLAAVLCLIHDLAMTLGFIALCHYIHDWPVIGSLLGLQDFKIDLPAVAALLTLVGYSVNDTIVVFDRIREVRGKNPELTPQMINDSINQTLSRTMLTALTTWLVVIVLYIWGGDGVHLFAFVMVIGILIGTYSSIYIASPLLLMFGEGAKPSPLRERRPTPQPEGAPA